MLTTERQSPWVVGKTRQQWQQYHQRSSIEKNYSQTELAPGSRSKEVYGGSSKEVVTFDRQAKQHRDTQVMTSTNSFRRFERQGKPGDTRTRLTPGLSTRNYHSNNDNVLNGKPSLLGKQSYNYRNTRSQRQNSLRNNNLTGARKVSTLRKTSPPCPSRPSRPPRRPQPPKVFTPSKHINNIDDNKIEYRYKSLGSLPRTVVNNNCTNIRSTTTRFDELRRSEEEFHMYNCKKQGRQYDIIKDTSQKSFANDRSYDNYILNESEHFKQKVKVNEEADQNYNHMFNRDNFNLESKTNQIDKKCDEVYQTKADTEEGEWEQVDCLTECWTCIEHDCPDQNKSQSGQNQNILYKVRKARANEVVEKWLGDANFEYSIGCTYGNGIDESEAKYVDESNFSSASSNQTINKVCNTPFGQASVGNKETSLDDVDGWCDEDQDKFCNLWTDEKNRSRQREVTNTNFDDTRIKYGLNGSEVQNKLQDMWIGKKGISGKKEAIYTDFDGRSIDQQQQQIGEQIGWNYTPGDAIKEKHGSIKNNEYKLCDSTSNGREDQKFGGEEEEGTNNKDQQSFCTQDTYQNKGQPSRVFRPGMSRNKVVVPIEDTESYDCEYGKPQKMKKHASQSREPLRQMLCVQKLLTQYNQQSQQCFFQEKEEPQQQHKEDEVANLIRKLTNLQTMELALQHLKCKLINLHLVKPSFIEDFVCKLLRHIFQNNESDAEEYLQFLKVVKEWNYVEVNTIKEILIDCFNHGVNFEFLMEIKGIGSTKLKHIAFVRAISVSLGLLDLKEVSNDIYYYLSKTDMRDFDNFCAGIQQVAKLIMQDMDNLFHQKELGSNIVAILNGDLSCLQSEAEYRGLLQEFDELVDALKRKLAEEGNI